MQAQAGPAFPDVCSTELKFCRYELSVGDSLTK